MLKVEPGFWTTVQKLHLEFLLGFLMLTGGPGLFLVLKSKVCSCTTGFLTSFSLGMNQKMPDDVSVLLLQHKGINAISLMLLDKRTTYLMGSPVSG